MAYSELIKNFDRIRTYLRSFYVYGFRHREDYQQKSSRSYDNERRRVQSWLGDYMSFGQDKDGKRVFLSVDSRVIPENPLYRAFRTKSFTDRDIMLHFHILDILETGGGLSITEIMDALSDRLAEFDEPDLPDESTVRKKLSEYTSLGLIDRTKRGRETIYMRSRDTVDLAAWNAAAAFFSEASVLGVIGSYVQDRFPQKFQKFRFKHHYILNALDSEILYDLLAAMSEKRMVRFMIRRQTVLTLPLKLYIGTQTGRQYLLGWSPKTQRFFFYRTDLIHHVKAGEHYLPLLDGKAEGQYSSSLDGKAGERDSSLLNDAEERRSGIDAGDGENAGFSAVLPGLEDRMQEFCSHVWGVAGNEDGHLDHIEMTVYAGPQEGFIAERLMREKRCGTVEQMDASHWKFSADVFDAVELLPWLRTFTGRVTELSCTNEKVTERFRGDVDEMAEMYGIGRE